MRRSTELVSRPLDPSDLRHTFELVPEQEWRRLQGQRLFMTGGTGFVGKWLLATLLHANARLNLNCRVTVLSRNPQAFRASAPDLAHANEIEIVAGDVRSFAVSGHFDMVLHAATDVVAKAEPEATFATCVDGTRKVLEFAERVGATRLLLVSSGAVYGRQPSDLSHVSESHSGGPDPLLASSAYGEGKRAAEWLAGALARRSAVQVKIARCFAFVGPYLPLDKQFAIGNFMRSALRQEQLVVEGDGTPYRSYLYASEMAAWLWTVLFRGRSGVAYNVGAEEAVSILEVARQVDELSGGRNGVRVLRPSSEARLAERYVPDTNRARSELGLPPPMPLATAIARTLAWHRRQPPAAAAKDTLT